MKASERLTFTQLNLSHKEESVLLSTNEQTMKYIRGGALSKLKAEERFEYQLELNSASPDFGFFSCYLKESSTYIGNAKFTHFEDEYIEVGYALLPAYWGMGLATEILVSLIAHAKTVKDSKPLIGIVETRNNASLHVLQKQGFAFKEKRSNEGIEIALYTKTNY